MDDTVEGILFCTPCFGGQSYTVFNLALQNVVMDMRRAGLACDVYQMRNESLVQRARNNMAARWYFDTPYSHLMFIDADIEFSADDVSKIWNTAAGGRDLVVGVYRMKKPDAAYAAWVDGELVDDLEQFKEDPVIRVDYAGTGFWLMSRKCYADMIEAYPELGHDAGLGEFPSYAFFDTGVRGLADKNTTWKDRFYVSEDYDFCEKYRKIGGEVLMHTDVKLTHWGLIGYK